MLASHHRALGSTPGNYAKWYCSIVFNALLQFYSLLHIYIPLFYEMCYSPVCAALCQNFSFYSGVLSLWPAAGYSLNLEEFLSTHANWKHHNEVNVFGLHCCHQSNHTAQHTARSYLTQQPWSTIHRWVLFEVMECTLHITITCCHSFMDDSYLSSCMAA